MTSPGHDEREPDAERHDEGPDWLDAVSRKLGHHDSTPEERLEQLLAERRRELEQHAGSFESAHVTMTQGVYVGGGDDAAARVQARLAEIRSRHAERVPASGWEQYQLELSKAGLAPEPADATG